MSNQRRGIDVAQKVGCSVVVVVVAIVVVFVVVDDYAQERDQIAECGEV